MQMDRKGFLGALAAAGGLSVVPRAVGAAETKAAPVGPVLEGKVFDGMAGAMTALLTPYGADGRVSEEAVEKIVEYGLRNGVTGFYVTGSTGESFLLTKEERKLMYARTVKAVRGRAKVIAQVGSMTTDDAVELARYAADVGCDWISSVAPVYFAQSWDSTYFHYKCISEATDRPFLVYSFGKVIDPDRDAKFFDLKNVWGMKYTGVDFWSVQRLRRRLGKEALFMAGEDALLLSALTYTDVFSGGIGLTYNFMPRAYSEICRLMAANDFAAATVWQRRSSEFVDLYVGKGNMSYAKAAMRYVGVDCGWCRKPFKPLTEAEYAAFAAELDRLGFLEKGAAS